MMIPNKDSWRQTPLGELITGSAFRPHPSDPRYPLSDRFTDSGLLLLVLAKDRAALAHVQFKNGHIQVNTLRQCERGASGSLACVMREEAERLSLSHVMVSVCSGWQAFVSRQALVPSRGDSGKDFIEEANTHLGPLAEGLITAHFGHPGRPFSYWFSVRPDDLSFVERELELAGLGLAGVRVGIAAMLEEWLSRAGDGLFDGGVLLSDGLGALYLDFSNGEPRCTACEDWPQCGLPRQTSLRPGDLPMDLLRYVQDSAAAKLMYVGPAEFAGPLQDCAAGRLSVAPAPSDAAEAVLSPRVVHSVSRRNSEARDPLPLSVRTALIGGSVLGLVCLVLGLIGLWAWRAQCEESGRLQRELTRLRAEVAAEQTRLVEQEGSLQRALGLRLWLSTHPRVQRLCLGFLSALPEGVGLERFATQLDEGGGQLSLDFVLSGAEEQQTEALRSLERCIQQLGYRVGERGPVTSQARGSLYRWRLLMPASMEEIST